MFRPCIDLHDGKVKQIVGSTLETNNLVTNFTADHSPSWYAKLFQKNNLLNGHIIMLGPNNEKAAFEAIDSFSGGLQIGGGINDQNCNLFLDRGASHIIVTSWIFPDGKMNMERVKKLSQMIGSKRLVIDLSCIKKNHKYLVATNKWNNITDIEINQSTIQILEQYCDELLIHAVNVEGKCQGIDKELIELLAKLGTKTITYAGGANSIDDFQYIYKTGQGRIKLTVGSALDIFGGNQIKFQEAVNFHNSCIKCQK